MKGQIGEHGRVSATILTVLIVGLLAFASAPSLAKPPDDRGQGGGAGTGGITSKDIVSTARLDGDILAWVDIADGYAPNAYDLGPDGKYGTSDDGKVVVLSSSGYKCFRQLDVQGRYIVWEEETSSNMRDIFYYDIGEDGRLGTTDDVGRTAVQYSETWDERYPHVWGENIVFTVTPYPSSSDAGIYIRNLGESSAVKLAGVGAAMPWGNFLALQSNDGKISILCLGDDGAYGTDDSIVEVGDLDGYGLVHFYGGRALFMTVPDIGGYKWKYADVSWDGESKSIKVSVDVLWTTTEQRTLVITNGEDVAYSVYDGNHDNNFDMYFYDFSEGTSSLLKDSRSNSYFPMDMDAERLLYTYSNTMYLYDLATGKHAKLG